jgi:hypothetical protein
LPEIIPDEKRANAKTETTNPTAVLLTPKDLANTGIAGKTMPKPSATKKDEITTTWTSRGNPETGDFKRLTKLYAKGFKKSKNHQLPSRHIFKVESKSILGS